MSTRIIIVDYVCPVATPKGDICTGCPRHDRPKGACQHFGKLGLKAGSKSTYLRHPNCIRAEERTKHASWSQIMLRSDFAPEDSANFDHLRRLSDTMRQPPDTSDDGQPSSQRRYESDYEEE